MTYITNIENFEDCLIDDSHQYEEVNNLLMNENFTFVNIVELYKQHFISKRRSLDFSYYRYNKPYITNQQILDRNIDILKSKILFDKSDREIADKHNIKKTTVNSYFKQVLKDIKKIIQKTYETV